MKATIFPLVILTCIHLSHVQGLVIESDNVFTQQRIYYGSNARPEAHLYVVQLQGDYKSTCGGSIISKHSILTSGHCILGYVCRLIKIFPATYMPGNRQTIFADQCIVHPRYMPNKFFEDLGVIRTQQNLVDQMRLKIIPLPAPNTNFPPNTLATILGWGELADGSYPDELIQGTVRIQDWRVCNVEFRHAMSCTRGGVCPVAELSPGTLCTIGSGNNPASACEGDSGGPLVINGVLAGVIAAAITVQGQCVMGAPNINVNVVHYLSWISAYA